MIKYQWINNNIYYTTFSVLAQHLKYFEVKTQYFRFYKFVINKVTHKHLSNILYGIIPIIYSIIHCKIITW